MSGNEVEVVCPHCGAPILIVIQREDAPEGRRLLPQTQADAEELRKQREW